MAQEGVAAALTLDSNILEDLGKAQNKLEAMRDAATGLADQLEKAAGSVTSITTALKGTNMSLKTAVDGEGAIKQIELVADAAAKTGQKVSAVKKEFDFTEEIRKTREKMYELQNVKMGMDRRDIGFTHAEYAQLEHDIDALKNKLNSLLEARRTAFSGDPTKQAAGQFREYIASLTATNDGLKQMNAYYKELEKSSAAASKQAKEISNLSTRAANALGMSPDSVEAMTAKLRELKAVKRELENESKKTGLIDPSVLQQVNAQITRTEAGIKNVNARLKETSSSANIVRSMLMTAFSPFLLQRFISEMVKVRGEFELSQRSLAVIIQDANKAQSMFNEITKIAVRSPFSVSDIMQQTKQLAAYRIETDKLIETTKMLGDISAGVGVDMNRLILAYGQVKAAEFLKGTELRQFSEAGVNMLGGLAKRFTEIYGRVVSVGEVMQMVSKRMVKFADVEAVLKEATEVGGAFYKMQEQQADTIQGRISNLNDRIQIMFNNIGKSHDKVIKGIITGLENIISHWQLLASIIEPLLGMMLLKGTVGLFGFTKVGKEIRTVVANMEGKFIAMTGELNRANKAAIRFRATLNGIGNYLKANWVSILLYIVALVADLIIKANQFKRTVKEIANEASAAVNDQVKRYELLLDIASDVNRKEEDRQKALDSLKSEYGNILDIQKIELGNIDQMNKAREHQIDLIRMQYYEEAKQKAMNEAIAESQKKAGLRANQMASAMKTMAGRGSMLGVDASAFDLGIKMLDNSDFDAIEAKVSDAILDGTVKGSIEAGKFAVKQAMIIAGRTDDEIEATIESLGEGYLGSIGNAFSKVQKQADIIDKQLQSVPGEVAAKAALPYKNLIKTLYDARHDFDELSKDNPLYEANPVLKEQDFTEYLQNVANQISSMIDSGALGEIGQHIKDDLNKQLENAFNDVAKLGGDVEQAIRKVQIEVASKYGKIGRSVIGQGLLKYEEGQSAADYIKNIQKELDDAKAVADEWVKIKEQIAKGVTPNTAPRLLEIANMFGTPDELDLYIKMLGELEEKLGGIGKVTNTPNGGNTYKQDLNAFITALQNARKELDKLSDEGDVKYIEKLSALGKKVGISLAKGFKGTDEEIMGLINKYKGKLAEEDRLNVELNLITDKAEEKMRDYSDLVKDLWDRYGNSKKLEEWGFMPQEGTTEEIMAEIKNLEHYLRNSGLGDAAIQLADEIAGRIRENARAEAEEVGKIMYEAGKKALDKEQQAFQTMMENVKKIRESEDYLPEEKDKAVADQVAKSVREIADAQWDAFKASESYALAFGDLNNLSNDLLLSLKANLQEWLRMPQGSLTPTELQAIQKQIRKIDEAMGGNKAKTFMDALATGFRELSERHDVLKEIPELSEAAASSMAELIEADKKLREAEAAYAQEQSPENSYALAKAQEKQAEAEERAANAANELAAAQARANKLYSDATKRMDEIENAYSAIGNEIVGLIDNVSDFASAFGKGFNEETEASLEGFKQGFQLIGTAITLCTNAMKVFDILQNTIIAGNQTLLATIMPFLGPLLIALAAVGTALAIIKARDVKLQKEIARHKDNIALLEREYDKLGDAMDRALDLKKASQSYAEMNANIAQQRQELLEAIAASEQREKKNRDAAEETKDLRQQLEDLDQKVAESRDRWLELLGGVTDYQGLARDWSSDWLDAFKETGNGLDSLKENFESLYDEIVAGQIWSRVMGPQLAKLQQMTDDILADGLVTSSEASALKAFRNTFSVINDEAENLARQLGVSGGSIAGDTLQRGVETVTEKTAGALESILNATRFDVSSTNVHVANIDAVLSGEGDNTILANLRSQTRYLADIARIASAVYYPGGHPKGAGALKVITEMA